MILQQNTLEGLYQLNSNKNYCNNQKTLLNVYKSTQTHAALLPAVKAFVSDSFLTAF